MDVTEQNQLRLCHKMKEGKGYCLVSLREVVMNKAEWFIYVQLEHGVLYITAKNLNPSAENLMQQQINSLSTD